MHTEADARRLWCPFARTQAGTTRYGGGPDAGTLCLGSECAAWRWRRDAYTSHRHMNPDDDPTSADAMMLTDGYNFEAERRGLRVYVREHPRTGACGLVDPR